MAVVYNMHFVSFTFTSDQNYPLRVAAAASILLSFIGHFVTYIIFLLLSDNKCQS